MGLNLADYERKAQESVVAFWKSRNAARQKQVESGKADQGERASVTAGKNMDGFVKLVIDVIRANGLADADIFRNRSALTLPGFFRPTKLWDILVVHKGELVAAIEFKSHVGPSFGNNFNNRTEEAIGTAHDFWTAYREGAFGEQCRPFVGWLILVEEADGSTSPVKDTTAHFSVFEEFRGASYIRRYDLLCQKLIREQLYTAASVITASKNAAHDGGYSEHSDMTSLKSFVSQLAGHVAAVVARLD
ncbi:MAG: restriction endonuclease [Chlorobaculum sp.]|nr:restriction endonuclease [Chlorobaculum sp.]